MVFGRSSPYRISKENPVSALVFYASATAPWRLHKLHSCCVDSLCGDLNLTMLHDDTGLRLQLLKIMAIQSIAEEAPAPSQVLLCVVMHTRLFCTSCFDLRSCLHKTAVMHSNCEISASYACVRPASDPAFVCSLASCACCVLETIESPVQSPHDLLGPLKHIARWSLTQGTRSSVL